MYGRVYQSMYQGTLRGMAHEILVFTNLIAFKDQDQFVDKTPKAIAEEVGLTEEEVRAALAILEAPDPESRSDEHEGRRIIRSDAHRTWGWYVVNGEFYDKIRSAEDRREKNREYKRAQRARDAAKVSGGQVQSENVRESQIESAVSAPITGTGTGTGTGDTPAAAVYVPPAPTDSTMESSGSKRRAFSPPSLIDAKAYCVEIGLPSTEADGFIDYYTANGWRVGKNPMKDWKAAMRNWKINFLKRGGRLVQPKKPSEPVPPAAKLSFLSDL